MCPKSLDGRDEVLFPILAAPGDTKVVRLDVPVRNALLVDEHQGIEEVRAESLQEVQAKRSVLTKLLRERAEAASSRSTVRPAIFSSPTGWMMVGCRSVCRISNSAFGRCSYSSFHATLRISPRSSVSVIRISEVLPVPTQRTTFHASPIIGLQDPLPPGGSVLREQTRGTPGIHPRKRTGSSHRRPSHIG
jgi:hypothetical protein